MYKILALCGPDKTKLTSLFGSKIKNKEKSIY